MADEDKKRKQIQNEEDEQEDEMDEYETDINEETEENVASEGEEENLDNSEDIEEITLETTNNDPFNDTAYIEALVKMAEEDEEVVDFLDEYKKDDLKRKQKVAEEELKLNESDLDSLENSENNNDD